MISGLLRCGIARVLCAAASAVAAPHSFAHAAQNLDLVCTPEPDKTGSPTDPIGTIRISFHNGSWSVVHIAASGARYDRATQYSLSDISTSAQTAWSGNQFIRPWLTMRGQIFGTGDQFVYIESLFDARAGGRKTFEMTNPCVSAAVTAPSPAPTALPAPMPTDNAGPQIDAPDGVLRADKRSVDFNGPIQITITSTTDAVAVNSISVNRGNCRASSQVRMPVFMKFGQSFTAGYFFNCNPIEVRVGTDLGLAIFTWPN